MKPFSNENFELKVYLKYIIDKSKDNKPKKCLMDFVNEKNTEELHKFLDKYEFTFINLTRLSTNDQELIPLIREFIKLYREIENLVSIFELEKTSNIEENNDNNCKIKVLLNKEGNDKNE
ncbi:MAG: hypothetical protein IJH20_04755 [Bacilli bacterium]|nr:hypothetical protein [Bacilli bacterium]